MTFDPVPWYVGGGAVHSPEVLRSLAYVATQGAQGVVGTGDLKVTAIGTPTGEVSIAPGADVIRVRQASRQSYVGRASTATRVPIDPTSSAGPRSDLVIARVRDGQYAPFDPYTDADQIANGPYHQPFVVSGVPAGTTRAADVVGYSAVELARIDIPASTAAITQAMITDLRELAQPRNKLMPFSAQPPVKVLSESGFVRWPAYNPQVRIPEWATWVSLVVTLSGVGVVGNTDGELRARIGDITGGPLIVDVDTAASRESFTVTASGAVSASDRGRLVDLVLEGKRYPSSPGSMGSNVGTHMLYEAYFEERAV